MPRLHGWKAKLLVAYVLLTLGASFLCVSVGSALYEFAFLVRSQPTQGVVLRNVETMASTDVSGAGKGETIHQTFPVFCPEIHYTVADGQDHAFTSKTCADPPSYAQGQALPIRYLKSHPDQAQVDSFGSKWGLALAFGIVSLLLLPITGALFLLLRQRGHSLSFLNLLTNT